MQDKTYVIAIFVVLGICCLGMYVAVSGYLNSNPGAFPDLVAGFQGTPIVVTISTYTPAPTQPIVALPPTPTIPAVPSPLGALQTITAAATIVFPTPAPTRVVVAATFTPASGFPSCAGFPFCPRGGPPDFGLGPGGNECPRNYIWGRVTDASGRGLRDRRIRFRNPMGEMDAVTTKAPPDPEGAYNIPAVAIGSTWEIWLLDPGGGEASPRVKLIAQPYTGVGNCPTRLDFVQQR
ncbi:MAG: hypothetical protein FJ009_05595 [Chloroflexi bacterium]|nr:hypothetical protein [Chloroflexota bacterium]